MKSFNRARRKALEYQVVLGDQPSRRLDRLVAHLADEYGIRPQAVGSDFLAGGRGEVVPEEGFLYYDRKLDKRREEQLELFAHELGHLVLHQQLTHALVPGDPIRGSAFLDRGTPALARYSRRSHQEAEASAFAAELLCPAAEAFTAWRRDPASTTAGLAETFDVSLGLLRVQLAEGLYRFVRGPEGEPESGAPEILTNDDQEHAATWKGSPVLVEAGPGTGKTRTLVRRVLHLIRDENEPPSEMLVLTFSNEAAEELRTRLEKSLGADKAAEILIATFHGLGVLVLQSYGHLIGLGSEIAILDDIGQEEILTEVLGRVDCEEVLNLKDPRTTLRRAAAFIGYLKDRLLTPELFAQEIESWQDGSHDPEELRRAHALVRIYRAYEEAKKKIDRVDFADLILLPLGLLQDHQEVRAWFREHCRWVMVDEYQDVSRSMARLLQAICGEDNPPWVVGDARQAIYRFRGAAPENVARFAEDFPGGKTFPIALNYRSSAPVIDAANHLAALLEDDLTPDGPPRRWSPGSRMEPLGRESVSIVEAQSDAAERRAIVEQVREWLARGIAPESIGILARRNIDVRNIALALSDAGIRAITSGLLTSEGAAGDLAAGLSALDSPRAAVPRLVYGLGRGQASREELEEAVRLLFAEMPDPFKRDDESAEDAEDTAEDAAPEAPDPEAASAGARAVADAVRRVLATLEPLGFSGDGWAVLCSVLFDAGEYLRRLLDEPSGLESPLALEEILSSLALAGNYRFGHPGTEPHRARVRLAERFRELLTSAAPGLIPPRPQAGAVRVMTCHASKGLEFPCVIVVGQTLNARPPDDSWLPPGLRQDPEDDPKQADSLLFVGVTRAQRAVVVSFSRTAGGTVRSRHRTLPPLLTDWMATSTVPRQTYELPVEPSRPVSLGKVWGGEQPESVSMYSLSGQGCAIQGYLEGHLKVRFRPLLRPLYPVFVSRVRQAMQRVVERAHKSCKPVPVDEAAAIAAEEWPAEDFAKHPHVELYRPRAITWVKQLASVYQPSGVPLGGSRGDNTLVESFDTDLSWTASESEARVPLHLIGRYRDAEGNQVAIQFRPEPMSSTDDHRVNWSALRDHQRLPFVLLQQEDPTLRPQIYSGADGQLYFYSWSIQKPAEKLVQLSRRARERFQAEVDGRFEAVIKDWNCDRCRCRMLCPYWIREGGG